ncbi:MAG: yttP 3 [Pelosinus sp.]|jgi:TetR/AcrR family transcriptional regulator|nr:yttP 3 [Pelosinus sp.]
MIKTTTQENLIEIATQLFATKGFAAVSVRELTDAAHINVSAISYHFNGKEGLYQAVLKEQLAPILKALQFVKSKHTLSPIDRLTLYADQIARIHNQRPFLARFINSESITPTSFGGPVIETHLSQVYQFIQATLQEGIDHGEFQADLDVNYAAISLVGSLNFYFIAKPLIQKFIRLTNDDNAEYTAHAFRIYLHGILTQV